jgi:ribonuclease BN (tRNA processing enzyme)
VLGSGGPDLRSKRASSGYLVWQEGKALILVDAGGGIALRFGESGADTSQLSLVLFSHFHADHSSDLPALLLSSVFAERKHSLLIYGPPGNAFFPSTTEFVADLVAKPRGAWRYLSSVLGGGQSQWLQPHDVIARDYPVKVLRSVDLGLDAVRTDHGRAPALAWRVEIRGKRIVFSGDTGGVGRALPRLAENADLLVAHNATSRMSDPANTGVLMPPSVIGQIAADAHVKLLVLSHRMEETLGKEHEEQTREDIKKHYSGALEFANDLDCFPL